MPVLMPTPAKAKTPVIGMEPPSTMSSPPAWACAARGAASVAPAASSSERRCWEMREFCMRVSLEGLACGCAQVSVAERPQMEKAAYAPPHFGKPMGLENQKADDQQAEDDGAHRRQEHCELGAVGQQVEHQLEQLGHHGHEHGAQDATQDGAHATYDDGGQEEDRHQQREALGRDHAEEVGPQAAGHPGVEGGQAERQQL